MKGQTAHVAKAETFYSTLAQITTGTLAIFATLLISYTVYIEARRAQYDDVIQQDRIDIAATLQDLRQNRILDASIPRFADLYQQALAVSERQSSPPEFQNLDYLPGTEQIVDDLSFDLKCILSPSQCGGPTRNSSAAALYSTMAELQGRGLLQGPWKGRLYLWTLDQLVVEITGGYVNEMAGFASPNTPIEQEHEAWIAQLAYPINPQGPGFNQWRRTFGLATRNLGVMKDTGERFIGDFQMYCRLRQSYDPECGQGVSAQIDTVFSAIESVRAKLRDIDIETQMRNRYTLATINRTRVASLVCIALCMGVLLPLGLLASVSGFRMSRVVLVLIACGSVGGSFWEFGRDVTPSTLIEDEQYRSGQSHPFPGGLKVIDWRHEPVSDFFSYRSAAAQFC
jgi:hypothetical protein